MTPRMSKARLATVIVHEIQAQLTPAQQSVVLALLGISHEIETGVWGRNVDRAYLAARTNLHKSTVGDALKQLVELGVLQIQRTGRASCVWFTVDDPKAQQLDGQEAAADTGSGVPTGPAEVVSGDFRARDTRPQRSPQPTSEVGLPDFRGRDGRPQRSPQPTSRDAEAYIRHQKDNHHLPPRAAEAAGVAIDEQAEAIVEQLASLPGKYQVSRRKAEQIARNPSVTRSVIEAVYRDVREMVGRGQRVQSPAGLIATRVEDPGLIAEFDRAERRREHAAEIAAAKHRQREVAEAEARRAERAHQASVERVLDGRTRDELRELAREAIAGMGPAERFYAGKTDDELIERPEVRDAIAELINTEHRQER